MNITLGSMGMDLTVLLPIGGEFVTTLTSSTPWPDGLSIELHLSNGVDDPIVWVAAISGTSATFDVSVTGVQAAITARVSIARLYYIPAGGGPLPWGHGNVRAV